MPVNVHIEGGRVGAQQMVVSAVTSMPVARSFSHNRIYFGFGQHEVSHHECATGRRLEAEPAAQRKAGLIKRRLASLEDRYGDAVAVDSALY